MNKKIVLALLMVLSVSLFLSGCKNKIPEGDNEQQVQKGEIAKDEISNNKQQVQQSKSTQSDAETIDYSKSYASILDSEREIYSDSDGFTYGYALKDLNGNGKNELLLLTKYNDPENNSENDPEGKNYTIRDIYSLVNGEPNLLVSSSAWALGQQFVGKDGLVYTADELTTDEARYFMYSKCKIKSDGTELECLESIECILKKDGNGDLKDSDAEFYHTKEDGKRIKISEQEYYELSKPRENQIQIDLNFIALS